MLCKLIAAAIAVVFSSGLATASHAEDEAADQDRLLIVNGNNGHVIYDDGRNDLFCVTRRFVVGHTASGRPVNRRTMRCR
jgi:hypothetical protein